VRFQDGVYLMCFPNALLLTVSRYHEPFRFPIERGLPSNVSTELREASVRQQVRLRIVLEPMVHRRGASLLLKSIGPMQQSVLYLRPTREQTRLCNIYKRLQKSDPKLKNFFRMWKDTKRVHNHPGVLAMPTTSAGSRSASPCADDDDSERSDSLWWEPHVKDREKLNEVENGYKMVVLLHILCQANTLGDKVLVFSSCLRTLDFIESVINRPRWSSFVTTLQDDAIGGFVKNEDYLRIDGTVGSGERGVRVTQFSDIEKARLFLISSRAGGIGINPVCIVVAAFLLHCPR
jgi:SNF2 family DNA or RNA helicase